MIDPSGDGGISEFWRVLFVCALLVVAAGTLGILRQPLIEDEAEFAEVAQSYISDGLPLAHKAGEITTIVHHPQLYHLMLSAASLAGGSEWGGRFLGVLCLLVCAWLAMRLARTMWENREVGLAAAVMVLLCPLCLRGALLLDIDNTLLPLLCLGFLVVLIGGGEQPSRSQIFGLMLLFGLGLLTKLTTPVLLIVPLWIFWGWKRRNAMVQVILGGVVLFGITWVAFCVWRGLNPLDPFWRLIERGSSGMGLTAANVITELGKRLVRYVLWVSPFLVGLLLMPRAASRNSRAQAALWWFVIVNVLFYWLIGGHAYGFPRYHVPAVMVALVLLSPAVANGWQSLGGRNWARWILLIVGAGFLWLISGDGFYPFYTYPEASALGKVDGLGFASQIVQIMVGVAIVAAIVVTAWRIRFHTFWRGVGVLSAVMLFPWWVSQDISMAQASYNTAYLYGESGIMEASGILEISLGAGMEIIAPKDVTYYTEYRFPHRVLGAVCDRGDLVEALRDSEVCALVYRDSHWIDGISGPRLRSEDVRKALQASYQSCNAGNFNIWVRRTCSQTGGETLP